MRHLVKVEVFHTAPDTWNLKYGSQQKLYIGTPAGFAAFLSGLGVSDDRTSPRSVPGISYDELVAGITRGDDKTVWAWDRALSRLNRLKYHDGDKDLPTYPW